VAAVFFSALAIRRQTLARTYCHQKLYVIDFSGRGGVIRTRDPLVPNQMRYQTALRPAPQFIYPLIAGRARRLLSNALARPVQPPNKFVNQLVSKQYLEREFRRR
jgi:hypothetical protein